MPLTRRALLAACGSVPMLAIGCSSPLSQRDRQTGNGATGNGATANGATANGATANGATVGSWRDAVVERRISYGDGPDQYGLLSLPVRTEQRLPTVVLIHGGFWRKGYGADLMSPLAEDLMSRGFAVWNIEYRRVGQRGGGYPGTLLDVAAAVDYLATLGDIYSLDLSRVAVVGHSAGGHLALWANSRSRSRPGDPGAVPLVQPSLTIGLAAVVDLPDAARSHLGGNATQGLLGGEPTEVPDAYRVAQPDLDVGRVVLIHGTADGIVPPEQSSAAGVHSGVIVTLLKGLDHFDMIDKGSPAWATVVDLLMT